MKIIIGRDEQTSQLKIQTDGKQTLIGQAGSVPTSVSRQHCELQMDDNGQLRLKNINPSNSTFVNGMPIESKVVKETDRIELGDDHYALNWEQLKTVLPRTVNIKSLEKTWNDYENTRLQQQIADRRFNALGRITGIITMIAIAMTMITGTRNMLYLALYATAVVLSLAFTIKAGLDAKKVPTRNKELADKFQDEYCCPACHHFLGNKPFKILKQDGACPYCKTKFHT